LYTVKALINFIFLEGVVAPKTTFVDERDTKNLADNLKVEEFLLSIFTPDIANAGTDARVFFDIGEHKFFLSPKRYAGNTMLSAGIAGTIGAPIAGPVAGVLAVSAGAVIVPIAAVLYIVGVAVNPMKDEFERGETDTFTLPIPGGKIMLLGDLRKAKLRLYHDGAGITSDWYVGKSELMVRVEGENTYRTYKVWPPLDWLDSSVSREAILQDLA
jgi:hypothetical protein